MKTCSFFRSASCLAFALSVFISAPADALEPSCSPFDAVYAPYPSYKRSDGVHYELSIQSEACTPPLCPTASVYLTTFGKDDSRLSKLTMHYECAGGDGRSCYVHVASDTPTDKKDRVQLKVTSLASDFNQTNFLGSDGHAAHALVIPDMPLRFRTPMIDWRHFTHSLTLYSKSTFTPDMAPDEFMPEVWVLSKCNH